VCWEITNDLKIWHSGSAENHGMMIKIKHEMNASDQVVSFYPRESTQPQELKPKLVVRVDWHKPVNSTPSPTPLQKETLTHTPSPTPTTMIGPPAPTETPTQQPALEPQAPADPLMLSIIPVLAIVLCVVFVLRRRAGPRNPLVSRKSKRSGSK